MAPRPAAFARVLAEDLEPEPTHAPADGIVAQRWLGVPCVIGAAFLFSIHGCTVRISMEAGITTLQLSFFVGLVRTSLSLLITPFYRRWWNTIFCAGQGKSFIALVFARNAIGCLALMCIFNA